MNFDSALKKLQSIDQDTQTEGTEEFRNLAQTKNPDFEKNFSLFAGLFKTVKNESVLLQLSTILRDWPFSPAFARDIISIMNTLADRFPMRSEEGYDVYMIANLSQALQNSLTTNQTLFQEALPVLMKLLQRTNLVKNLAYSHLATYTYQNPALLAPHAEALFEVVRGGFDSMIFPLITLYNHRPEVFEKSENLGLLVRLSSNPQWGSLSINILLEISKKKANLLIPHVAALQAGLNSPLVAGSLASMFAEIARVNPQALFPYCQKLHQAAKMITELQFQVPNILSLIGRTSKEKGAEVIPLLSEYLQGRDQNAIVIALQQIKNVIEMDKTLLKPYLPQIQKLAQDPHQHIREQAKALLDYYEGKDLSSLMEKFEKLNREVKQSISTVDDLKKYVDTHIADLKNFMAQIAKKIPVPVKFTSEGFLRKTLKLYFICEAGGERCLFTMDRAFTTETKEFNRWLKVAVSALKLGKSVLQADAGEVFDDARELYKHATGESDQQYLSIVNEPFLTSAEQDHLVNQLRESRYFDFFGYDAQKGKWCCLMCRPKA